MWDTWNRNIHISYKYYCFQLDTDPCKETMHHHLYYSIPLVKVWEQNNFNICQHVKHLVNAMSQEKILNII